MRDFIHEAGLNQKTVRRDIKDIISDVSFVPRLKKGLEILRPIDQLIVEFQSDSVPVSYVYEAFITLQTRYDENQASETSLLTENEVNFIKQLIKERFQFIYGDAHGIGYLLDPRYIGEKMDPKLKSEIEDFLIQFPVESSDEVQDQKQAIYTELLDYIVAASSEKKSNTFRYQTLVGKKKSILTYWLVDGKQWPLLQQIAIKAIFYC